MSEAASEAAGGAGRRTPHPVVWTILYLPFGALGGFITVALTFEASRHGLSITEGALFGGAQLLSQWLKWLWAPLVDVTLTPKRWYVIATVLSAVGVFAMSAAPMTQDKLVPLLAIIATASLVNSVVGMAVEALMASATPPEEVGRVSAWFQAGNLGGTGFGGALGLVLMEKLPAPWMSGAVMGVTFLACCGVLRFTEDVQPHAPDGGAGAAVKGVLRFLGSMLKTRGGLLAGLLCILPIATGAAQGVLTQGTVAAKWGAGATAVALVQGLLSGVATIAGCFAGGWLCQRFAPRTAYAGIALLLAAIAAGMAVGPATVTAYVGFNFLYAIGVGLAYSAFTAFVLSSMGAGAAATKYNVFASLSNFPLWWLGLLLGVIADRHGERAMLLGEAALGVVGVVIFAVASRAIGRRAEAV